MDESNTVAELLRMCGENGENVPCFLCHEMYGDGCRPDHRCRDAWGALADRVEAEIAEARDMSAREGMAIIAEAEGWPPLHDGESVTEWMARCWLPRPRYEDGEVVGPGDVAVDEFVHGVVVLDDGSWRLHDAAGDVICGGKRDERVRPAAPEVLLADGKPAKRGETVWRTTTGHEGTVDGVEDGMVLVHWADLSLIDCPVDPAWLTSTPPVLAADGKPLREGDAVWLTNEGAAHAGQSCVKSNGACGLYGIGPDERLVVEDACLMPDGLEHVNLDKYGAWCPSSWLTHEEPVTQEQVDEWAAMPMREYYAERIGHNVGLLDDAEVY